MEKVDARGMKCPAPVIETRKALGAIDSGEIEVLVDSEASRDNVMKMAGSQGCDVRYEELQGGYAVTITKQSMVSTECESIFASGENKPLVFLIKSSYFGAGDDRLGKILMRSFLFSLTELDREIKAVIFMNSGIFLTTPGSEVLDILKKLQERGVEILSCGTCLDYYQKKEEIQVGQVTNMYSSVDYITMAGVKTIII